MLAFLAVPETCSACFLTHFIFCSGSWVTFLIVLVSYSMGATCIDVFWYTHSAHILWCSCEISSGHTAYGPYALHYNYTTARIHAFKLIVNSGHVAQIRSVKYEPHPWSIKPSGSNEEKWVSGDRAVSLGARRQTLCGLIVSGLVLCCSALRRLCTRHPLSNK